MEAADRWEALKRRYAQAIKLPPEQRDAFLDKTCPPELRPELDSLLANYEENPDGFEPLAGDAAAAILEALMEEQHKDRHDGRYPLIGQTLSHYQVIEGLGGGGMGVVYKAHDTKLGRNVALKFLPPHMSTSDEAKKRFIQEAKAASALDHPNICTIHEIGETDDGQLFIAMAYYEGETLKKKIGRGPLPLDEALGYTAQVARGLAKAHAHGIIHRDIKPANVIVTEPAPAEEGGIAKILDFGLAKMADVQLTQTGARMGTVAYMSPEQARGDKVDHRTDIWSLGTVLYEMLTGERPFKGDYPEAIIYSVLHETLLPITEINPDVSTDLEHVVSMCLEKDRELRYPSVVDLLADLEVWTKKEEVLRPSALRTTLIAGASVLVTLLVLLAITIVTGKGGLPNQKHLAVLPFAYMGDDSETQVFCEGLVEIVTSQLARIEQFSEASFWVVSAREIVNRGVKTPDEARRVLGANLVIAGVCQQNGEQARLFLTLEDAVQLRLLNTADVTAPASNLLVFQDSVVSQLATMLETTLSLEARRTLTAGGTKVPAAFEFYVRGIFYSRRFDEATNVEEAIRLFEQAIEADPSYALAYAGLGEAYWRKYDVHTKKAEWAWAARRNCEHALQLDNRLAPAHETLALIYIDTGDLDAAEREIRQALDLNPSSYNAYRIQARIFSRQGNVEAAEAAYKKSIDLRPDYWLGYNALGNFYLRQFRYPEAAAQFERVTELTRDNFWGYNALGAAFYFMDNLDGAVQMWERALDIQDDDKAYNNLASIYYVQGQYAKAARSYEKALAVDKSDYKHWGNLAAAYFWAPAEQHMADSAYKQAIALAEADLALDEGNPTIQSLLAIYYARIGKHNEARTLADQALANASQDKNVMVRVADVYLQLENPDKALNLMEMAVQAGYSRSLIEQDPFFNSLRENPRYQRLLEEPDTEP